MGGGAASSSLELDVQYAAWGAEVGGCFEFR